MNKIAIHVEGGLIQWIGATEDIEYVIVDEDVRSTEELELPLDVYDLDQILTTEEFEKIKTTGKIEL